MPSISFKLQFADAVESGRKRQTIRAPRNRPIKVGDPVYLFTGMRTKQCRRLGVGTCTETHSIEIDYRLRWKVAVDGRSLGYGEAHAIAMADGFGFITDLVDFFEREHGLPFRGTLIRWKLEEKSC